MAKVILEFDKFEEKEELNDALNGSLYKLVLWELEEELRRQYKYEDKTTISIEEVRKLIYDLLDARKLEI